MKKGITQKKPTPTRFATVAEAYGMAKVAEEAGIQRESLYRSLSPSGNPTLKTLMVVMKAVGLRISAVPDKEHAHV